MRVLYFFPLNVARRNAGNITRALSLLRYFKSRGIAVDYVSSNHDWGEVINEDQIKILREQGLIDHHYGISKRPPASRLFAYLRVLLPELFLRKLLKIGAYTIPDFGKYYPRRQFSGILKTRHYDAIIISYTAWANLIKGNKQVSRSKLILDTHDLLTAQQRHKRRFSLGASIADEVKRMNLFDEVWAISTDEQYLFGLFCKPPVKLIPVCFEGTAERNGPKDTDILYVASDNPHNVAAAKWFFGKVYPLLPSGLMFTVVGTVSGFVPDRPNITKISHAEELSIYYRKSRIVVCPMLSGTGVKVKVVEALSYGLPVVCTPKGVDGLINKRENGCLVAETADEFAEHVKRLIEDESLYRQLCTSAIAFFGKYYSRDTVYRLLDKSFGIERQ